MNSDKGNYSSTKVRNRDRDGREDGGFSETELDRLQARWVIGKQRGKEKSLTTKELLALLNRSRLSWKALSTQEKHLLTKTGYTPNKSNNVLDKKIAESTFRVVLELLATIEEHKDKLYTESEWEKMNMLDKKNAKDKIFKFIYGDNPKAFGYKLYQVMAGAENGV